MLHASCTSPIREGLGTLLGFGGGFLGNGLERRDRLAGKRAGVWLLACSVWRVEIQRKWLRGTELTCRAGVGSPFGKGLLGEISLSLGHARRRDIPGFQATPVRLTPSIPVTWVCGRRLDLPTGILGVIGEVHCRRPSKHRRVAAGR